MPKITFIKENLIPAIVTAGDFGKNAQLLEVVMENTEGKDQFSSEVLFCTIHLKRNDATEEVPVVLKFQTDSEIIRFKFQTGLQFYNEVFMYKEFIPLLSESVQSIFPLFYYGVATLDESPDKDVIIVENLSPRGYRLTTDRVFLDFSHCSLVFKKLGEFHAGSYVLKKTHPELFSEKIKQLREHRWLEMFKEDNNYFYGEIAKRGIIPLLKSGENLDLLNRLLERLKDTQSLMLDLIAVNTMSVVCHGDFCRNNMFFRYDSGKPIDVKFFDVATARYASPVIDMSLFLFLNMTSDVRTKHLDELLKIYHDSLVTTVGSGIVLPTLHEITEEFHQKALYGYIVACFFLPLMVFEENLDIDAKKSETAEEIVADNLRCGGEKGTDLVADIVKDLIKWSCL